MVVFKIQGRLGNQFFIYAAGMALSLRGHDVRFVFEDMREGRINITNYGISQYNINWDMTIDTKDAQTVSFYSPIRDENYSEYNHSFFDIQDATYVQGWFQSDMFFKDIWQILKKHFVLKTPMPRFCAQKKSQILKESYPCFIHVRRGDYISSRVYTELGSAYYKSAIEIVKNKHPDAKFYIFSNDFEFIEKYFIPSLGAIMEHYELVDLHDEESGHLDLELMRACKGGIIANSTFSWWAGYMIESQDKIIITPEKYHTLNKNLDLFPRDFIVLNHAWGYELDKEKFYSKSYKHNPPPPRYQHKCAS